MPPQRPLPDARRRRQHSADTSGLSPCIAKTHTRRRASARGGRKAAFGRLITHGDRSTWLGSSATQTRPSSRLAPRTAARMRREDPSRPTRRASLSPAHRQFRVPRRCSVGCQERRPIHLLSQPAATSSAETSGTVASALGRRPAQAAVPASPLVRRRSSSEELAAHVHAARSDSTDCASPVRCLRVAARRVPAYADRAPREPRGAAPARPSREPGQRPRPLSLAQGKHSPRPALGEEQVRDRSRPRVLLLIAHGHDHSGRADLLSQPREAIAVRNVEAILEATDPPAVLRAAKAAAVHCGGVSWSRALLASRPPLRRCWSAGMRSRCGLSNGGLARRVRRLWRARTSRSRALRRRRRRRRGGLAGRCG